MANVYAALPVPGYSQGPVYTDPEILYSTAGFTQKGVTLAGGQGVLKAGTVLARKTADKKYYAYASGGAGGLGAPKGVLRRGVDLGTAGAADQLGNIVIQGIVKLQHVTVGATTGNAAVDATIKSTLGAVVDPDAGYMKF